MTDEHSACDQLIIVTRAHNVVRGTGGRSLIFFTDGRQLSASRCDRR
jgi:hypothetical protein